MRLITKPDLIAQLKRQLAAMESRSAMHALAGHPPDPRQMELQESTRMFLESMRHEMLSPDEIDDLNRDSDKPVRTKDGKIDKRYTPKGIKKKKRRRPIKAGARMYMWIAHGPADDKWCKRYISSVWSAAYAMPVPGTKTAMNDTHINCMCEMVYVGMAGDDGKPIDPQAPFDPDPIDPYDVDDPRAPPVTRATKENGSSPDCLH